MQAHQPPRPIRSLREDDPEVEERIDAFVARLGETIDGFQDNEARGDLHGLRELADELAEQAQTLGYPDLVAAARAIGTACGEDSPAALRKSVEGLTELSQRIRRGHRSAA